LNEFANKKDGRSKWIIALTDGEDNGSKVGVDVTNFFINF
jgi:hypothetical protein